MFSFLCFRNILRLLPKGPTLTVLNRLSLCLRHMLLNLTPMNVLISLVFPANIVLGDFHVSNGIYQHLMNCIFPIVSYMWHILECFFVYMAICWYGGQNINGHQNVGHSWPCAFPRVASPGWPLCKQSGLTLIEVSQHTYLSYQALVVYLWFTTMLILQPGCTFRNISLSWIKFWVWVWVLKMNLDMSSVKWRPFCLSLKMVKVLFIFSPCPYIDC